MSILAVYGTRPEYLKIKPLLNHPEFKIDSCFIKQHTDIIEFGESTHTLEIDVSNSNRLNQIFGSIFSKLENVLKNYDSILIQGDTATVAASALCAFNLRKKIIYLESGLRTHNITNPFPEEGYRQMVSRIANIHLCPTELSKQNLIYEKVSGRIYVVGNTSLDNLVHIKDSECSIPIEDWVLITLHRTENLPIINEWFESLEFLAKTHIGTNFFIFLHPNPIIKKAASIFKHVRVNQSIQHGPLINYIKKCKLLITDSGGIQEEASFLNKKVLVCRKSTERPEGLISGHSILVPNPANLIQIFEENFKNFKIDAPCPFGDGHATEKIIKILKNE